MKKLTAVEWLIEVIKDSIDAEDGSVSINWLHDGTLDKAHKLFEEQIVDAFDIADNNYPSGNGYDNGSNYYSETFNQTESWNVNYVI